jgi:hypothetical protein
MKVYAGPPAAARAYLEVDRGRAYDYYLAEGTGLARRFLARDGRVQELAAGAVPRDLRDVGGRPGS